MSDSDTSVSITRIRGAARSGYHDDRRSLAEEVAADWEQHRSPILESLTDPAIRRWAREHLASLLTEDAAGELAQKLLDWPDDFSPDKRDRTTAQFVRTLSRNLLIAHLYKFAGSNAAGALWERIAEEGDRAVLAAAREILLHADASARETTLHLLVLDPYGESPIGREGQDELLQIVLDDPDPEIRGLAAEVVAADMPGLILERWDTAPLDGSERVRMAFWQAALVHRPEEALEHAGQVVLDPDREQDTRRTALIAAGEGSSTRQMSPLLQALLRGDDEVLATDAAQLMWRHHRAPDIAGAAAESRFEQVRELAERLLHPERGSPAAGGSRPGDPTRTGEIFDQISGSRDWRGPEPEE